MGTKDRLELESRVLAAALKQSVELGDNNGVSLAHRQIFLLIRSAHGAGDNAAETKGVASSPEEERAAAPAPSAEQSASASTEIRKRKLPNIVWTEAEESSEESEAEAFDDEEHLSDSIDPAVEPSDETAEVPLSGLNQNQSQGMLGTGGTGSGAAVSLTRVHRAQPRAHLDENVFDAYGILGVEQVASFEKIHVGFLVLIRRLLFEIKKTKRRKRKELLQQLQELWIAHDVLTDPVTRTDYDFRILGLRGAPDVIIDSPDSEGQVVIGSTIPLRIGELLQCAGLLEPTELEIAADMHRAMPEMLFGAFLVKQGFITEPDLDQVLMGQRLLKMGYMSVATFQSCMRHWIDSDMPIYESAVTEGLLTLSEMERIIAQGLKDTDSEIPAISGGQVGFRSGARVKVQSFGTGPMLNQEEAIKRQVSADHAVPDWKDQLDWSAPPEEEAPPPARRKEVKATMESVSYQIEGITGEREDRSPERKSLRSLMKGMHLSDDDDEASEQEQDSEQEQQEEASAGSLQSMLEFSPPSQSEPEPEPEPEPAVALTETDSQTVETVPGDSPVVVSRPNPDSSSGQNQFDDEIAEEFFDEEEDENLEDLENLLAYDEEDEPVMEMEDSLELPSSQMTTSDVETSTDLDQVQVQVQVQVQEEGQAGQGVEMRTSGTNMPVVTGTEYDAVQVPEEEETTEEIRQIALTLKKDEESGDSSSPSDQEEVARQALKKSIEWQVMYKIKGSLADMLLSDSDEPDVPPLAPRLEDIDVIPRKSAGEDEDDHTD
ncbi:hypothetical protein GC174_17435 [bacterium]|nr:hypothetical protein [bacterium]